MRCKLSTPGSPEYIPPITLSNSATPVSPYTLLPSLSPSSLYLRTPAVAQSSAKLIGGGGEKQIFPPERPPSATPNSLNHGLQLYLQTRSITASKYISNLARSSNGSVSLSSLDHVVVKWWREKADSPSSTLHHTSCGVRSEFLRQSGSASLSRVERRSEDRKGYLAMMNHTNWFNL